MNYFNTRLLDKVYLLEFQSLGFTSTFGFSVPPQSEDFQFGQRIGETKTFGGSVFEDYGNDTGKITLSGSTINSEIRQIYTNNKAPKFVSGEEEIFELKKVIDTFGEPDKLKNKTISLYALDSSYKSWNVVVNDLSIKRGKDKPLSYDFTLTCTAYSDRTNILGKKKKRQFDFVDSIYNFLKQIDETMDSVESYISNYRIGLDYVKSTRKCIEDMEKAIKKYVSIADGFADTTTEYIQEIKPFIKDITESPGRVALTIEKTLLNSAMDLNAAIKELCDYLSNFDESEVYQDIIETFAMASSEIVEAWKVDADDLRTNGDSIVREVKRSANQNSLAVIPGNANTSDTVIPIYGYVTKVLTDADSWDGLAMKYYGDPSYSTMLATYNLTQNKELKAGNLIKIPIIDKEKSRNENNLIYSTPEKLDNYGKDIALEDGDFASLHGDFTVIGEAENLAQSINARLSMAIDSRIRLTVYGIRTNLGGITEANSYVYSSIERTLLQDPRVRTVDSIKFEGKGDCLYVNVIYTDINEDRQIYGGTI